MPFALLNHMKPKPSMRQIILSLLLGLVVLELFFALIPWMIEKIL